MDPVKEGRVERRLCTVDWPSDSDHLFTGEGEGCEEPFERDGTTRRSRGRKWHVGRSPVRAARGLGTRMYSRLERGARGSLLCSGIVVISVFRGSAPKARRETFLTTETFLGKPSRVSEGHLKLVPRPWWSLGACRPVLGGRLLVSGAGPRELCQKRRP
ncbi:hypothetical protein CRG98_021069 [Punica granatum]|uniref:Uncharacterized protein n=1 Tax=Punica granatum TaxID=22663 RepID=A0A2I0JQG7_PUNGR|nr:hypothetical protein CRG98_021069 [Punica granatum]